MKKKILWISRTATFIAVLIILQIITKTGGQLLTGSAVNMVLIISVLTSGLLSGMTVALLSPFFAFILGIGPAFIQIIPFIALGNLAYIILTYLISNSFKTKGILSYLKNVTGIMLAAFVKFGILYIGIVKLLLPFMTQLKDKQLETISGIFSWPQFITALVGGIIGIILSSAVNKAIFYQKEK